MSYPARRASPLINRFIVSSHYATMPKPFVAISTNPATLLEPRRLISRRTHPLALPRHSHDEMTATQRVPPCDSAGRHERDEIGEMLEVLPAAEPGVLKARST